MPSRDKPTLGDRLGFGPYVDGIGQFIRSIDPEELPVVVGIYGSWGSGKTSFMLQLQRSLDQGAGADQTVPTVWFDAWKYDRVHDVRSALVYRILLELHKKAEGSARWKVTQAMRKLSQLGIGFVQESRLAVGLPYVGIQVSTIAEARKHIRDAVKSFETVVDQFSEYFAAAVRSFVEQISCGNDRKLVIFIDDLDRCLPENVIIVLEALKLFTAGSDCVFVIGVDRTVVENAVRAHYGAASGVLGREYLDKIVQYPFTVPSAGSQTLKACFAADEEFEGIDASCSKMVDIAADSNPRTYLRIISAWRMVKHLAPLVGLDHQANSGILMFATIILIRVPELHEVALREPIGLERLLGYCASPNDNKPPNAIGIRAPLFQSFFENPSTRQLLASIVQGSGKGPQALLGSAAQVKAAFNLSARIK